MANDSYNPQLSAAVNSPLETLARQALRRYGDNAAGVVEAEAVAERQEGAERGHLLALT